jgi:uncharacterized protein YkwD
MKIALKAGGGQIAVPGAPQTSTGVRRNRLGLMGLSPGASVLVPLVLLLSLPSCSHARRVDFSPAAAWAAPADTATLERQAYRRVNDHRVSRRKRALAWSDVIAEQARQHSLRMARGAARFGHGGFEKRVKAINRSRTARKAAENVAIDYTAERAVQAWLKRGGHRANIEGDYDLTGVGAAVDRQGRVYFTQIFIKSK